MIFASEYDVGEVTLKFRSKYITHVAKLIDVWKNYPGRDLFRSDYRKYFR